MRFSGFIPKSSYLYWGLPAFAVVLGSVTLANAGILVSDSFDRTTPVLLNGDKPDVVAVSSNGVYLASGGTGWTQAQISSNRAVLSTDYSLVVSTGISAPTTYNLSILFNLSGMTQANASADNDRGANLGFWSGINGLGGSGYHGNAGFTGITVLPNGNVNVISVAIGAPGSPTNQVVTLYDTASISGFNVAADHTLSYSIDTATGAYSNVRVDGNLIGLAGADGGLVAAGGPDFAIFNPTSTAYAGFAVSAANGFVSASYDNLLITSPLAVVPEPTSSALLGLSALGLIRRRRSH